MTKEFDSDNYHIYGVARNNGNTFYIRHVRDTRECTQRLNEITDDIRHIRGISIISSNPCEISKVDSLSGSHRNLHRSEKLGKLFRVSSPFPRFVDYERFPAVLDILFDDERIRLEQPPRPCSKGKFRRLEASETCMEERVA